MGWNKCEEVINRFLIIYVVYYFGLVRNVNRFYYGCGVSVLFFKYVLGDYR